MTEKLKSRIWITERCHMKAEKRSRFLELYFHIVLALFALSSIGVSILGGAKPGTINESVLSFSSITTLCLSLLIFGFKFGETAAKHRSCYLSLQHLRAKSLPSGEELEDEYINILKHHPNHTSGDYMRLAVSNVFSSKQSLTDPNGDKICFSAWQRLSHVCGWFFARLFLGVFAVLPLLILAFGIGYGSLC